MCMGPRRMQAVGTLLSSCCHVLEFRASLDIASLSCFIPAVAALHLRSALLVAGNRLHTLVANYTAVNC